MSEIEYVEELPRDGRSKYPQILDEIRQDDSEGSGGWTPLKSYDNHASANDAANRLRRGNADFEFAARVGTVYAKYVGGPR